MRRVVLAVLFGVLAGLAPGIASAAPVPAAPAPPGAGLPGLVIGDGSPLRPGDTVRAQMGCEEPVTTPVTGPGLTGSAWERDPEGHQPWAKFASVTVAADAADGEHTASATCGSRTLTTTVVVDAPTSPVPVVLGAVAVVVLAGAGLVLLRRRRRRV